MADFNAIARKWQKKWEEAKAFRASEKGRKFYVLEMFPYPSASGLHMGHALNYTIGDIFARFKRMQGYSVLHPMGFDSFGLPAENAAIAAKSHPKKFTEEAITNYIAQMKGLGLSYDWERRVETHKPDYYRWDQWIFLKMLEKGLAYKKEAPVNWCPKCNTVLANEQVHAGKCWRREDTEVHVRQLEQWFLKTTAYADELYEGIEKLEGWPELIKTLQRNWINRSEGTEITFTINGRPWPIFTTRTDTLFGVTFLVVSARHPRLQEFVTPGQKAAVEAFTKKIHTTKQEDLETLEKEGVFTGSTALHPLTGEKIPVWAGNFVLADYGSGMVMAVPAHDQRDFVFAKKYGIPIKVVVQPQGKVPAIRAFAEDGTLVDSSSYSGMTSAEAREQITSDLEKEKKGKKSVQYRLKDWLISRQRFWGTPIPIIYCQKCGTVPVPEKDLPVVLPEDISFSDVTNPLASSKKFLETACPRCKGKARRETDTMDTFVNSSWYQLRYTDPKNKRAIFDPQKAGFWNPIDLYIGGKEHACMHLIYIRFYTKFLRDLGLLPFDEPAVKLFNQGILLGPDGNKMSKSLGNVIVPEHAIGKYGVDTVRLFLVSVAAPDKDILWSEQGVEGSLRFLKKVEEFFSKYAPGKTSKRLESKLHRAIRDVTPDIESMKYNNAVIKLREVFDTFEEKMSKHDAEAFILMLSPFAPHFAEELWEHIGNKPFVSSSSWPKHDAGKIDEKLDILDALNQRLRKDIIDILGLLKVQKPSGLTLIVAERWRYDFVKMFRAAAAETRNFKALLGKLLSGDLKKHGQDVTKIISAFLKDPTKVPPVDFTQQEELEALEGFKAEIEQEFGCAVNIELAEASKEQKAKNALPGKPAIIVS